MQDAADMELLRQYVHRNSDEAFAALVTRHVNMVYSAALRKTGNASAAEEITQAVFIILARKAGRLGQRTVLPGWLYQTTRLTAANFLRTEIRRVRREQEAYVQSRLNEAESEFWPQIMPLLEDAMGKLGEKDRNVIVLRFLEGKSMQEVGLLVGASENAAKKRVGYALEKLRKIFAKRGVVSTTAIIAGAMSACSAQAAPAALATSITTVAAAKGAVVSGSTLTLIKGALKIMAWTKAKMAVVVGAVLLLATGTTIIVHHQSNSVSGDSKVSVSVINTTNVSGRAFYVLSFVNRDRKPIRWRGISSEVQGNSIRFAPTLHANLPWGFSSNLLEPGGSVIAAVGAPLEPGKWRVCASFSPNGTLNVWDGLTNTFTAKSPWFSSNR